MFTFYFILNYHHLQAFVHLSEALLLILSAADVISVVILVML